MRIAQMGYSYPAYAFMPAYPFMIRIANLLTGEWLVSSFIVSFLLGIAAVPMFQLLAEEYMNKSQALTATLLFFFFPSVFFTTSIAYSESLFAVAIIGSWLFCLRKNWVLSTAFAVMATLSRVYGLLIALPLVLRLLRGERRKAAFLVMFISLVTFLGWNYYLFNLTGDWMALWSSQNHWREGWLFGINSIVRSAMELVVSGGKLSPIAPLRIPVVLLWLVMIAFVGIPVVASIDIDRDFGLYGTLLFLFIISFGNVWSFGRFVSFIVPAWLTVRANGRFAATVVVFAFLVSSVAVWYQFVILGFGH